MNDLREPDPRRRPPPIPAQFLPPQIRASDLSAPPPIRGNGEGQTHAKLRSLTKALSILVIIVVAGLVGAWYLHRPSSASLARRTRNSVVVINVTNSQGRALGSGFFVKKDEVVTNYHVIEGASTISVELYDGTSISNVRLLRADPAHDLALLQVESKEAPLALRADDDILQGDAVYALGNPEGYSFTFSSGVVSSRREYKGMHLVQITAPISHGSSGGPVIDDEGRVIGVSKAVNADGQNLNFAIEVRHVRELLSGTPTRASGAAAPISTPSNSSYVIDRGVYAVTYNDNQPDSLALFVERADDSLIALVGSAYKRSLPTLVLNGALNGSGPATFDYGKPEVQFVIDSIESRRLFLGHFTIYANGSVSKLPFTAARRHPFFSGSAAMVIDGGDGTNNRPVGATADGVTFAGTVDWSDAGVGYVSGHLHPYRAFAALQSTARDSLPGFVAQSDSVVFHIGALSCQVPIRSWPSARGACWSRTRWYGVTLAERGSTTVSRFFWEQLPLDFSGILGAARTRDGGVELEYLTHSTVVDMGTGKSSRKFLAWRTAAGAGEFASPTIVPWPESSPYYDLDREPGEGLASIVIGHDKIALLREGRLDTVPLPSEFLTQAGDSVADMRAAPLSPHVVLVELSAGKACNFFLLDDLPQVEREALEPCRRSAATYDLDNQSWRVGSTHATYSYRYWGWKSARINDSTAILKVIKDDPNASSPQQLFFSVDGGGFRPLENPLPDSSNSRLNIRQSEVEDGKLWLVAKYCRDGDQKCFQREEIPTLLLRWSPGQIAHIVKIDSTGALIHAQLLRTNANRVLMLSRDTVRLLGDWSSQAYNPLGDVGVQFPVALDDTSTNEILLVSNLGEIAHISLPLAQPPIPSTGWIQRLAAWAHSFDAHGGEKQR